MTDPSQPVQKNAADPLLMLDFFGDNIDTVTCKRNRSGLSLIVENDAAFRDFASGLKL